MYKRQLFDILTVQKEAVKIFHPVGKERPFQHFNFCNITGRSGNPDIGKDDVKIAAVVAHVKNRAAPGNKMCIRDRGWQGR